MLGKKLTHLGTQQVAWGATSWERPAEWLALPTVEVGDETLVGLMRVNDAANNHVALICAGDYTVDWGDGNTENFASGVKATHTYDFTALDAETETSGGWRQAIVVVTPQAGQALTLVNLDQTTGDTYTQGWLDVVVAGPAIGAIEIGGTTKPPTLLEQFEFVGGNVITSTYRMFEGCSSLVSVPAMDTSSVTNMGSTFQGCSRLASAICTGLRYSVSIASCAFARSAIVDFFTGLGTSAGAGQVVNVSANPGTASLTPDDIAIATAKGWTVTT